MRALVLLLACLCAPAAAALPPTLAETGLGDGAMAFTPQYALWSDGTTKRRWLSLPPGSAIDASDPDAWDFPPGTKAWKEFSREGRIETRYIERQADGSWRFAAYAWNAEGTKAELAPEGGKSVGNYRIPSRTDCLACHEAAASPILGFSAVQLPGAELQRLAGAGHIKNLPATFLAKAPRSAALGYLHANCGHCHNDSGPLAEVGLFLAQRAASPAESAARTIASLAERSDRFGRTRAALIPELMRSKNRLQQMPPLGVTINDLEGIALVERWILQLQSPTEPSR